MSTRSTSSKSKSAGKTAAKKPSKSATAAASAPKSRLAGPKPPKSRAAPSVAKRATQTVSAASVAAARDGKPNTSKIPAPPPPAQKTEPAAPVELKKPELVDLVVSRSDIKKKYAKPVVEAMLEVLGETLAKGREMNLQPFGKVKYNRTKETISARVVVTKIRQSKPAKTRSSAAKSKVADAAE